MQALAVIRLQVGLAAGLVVPGLVAHARFHGREDPHQSGVFPAFFQNLLDPFFLAEVALADELDLQPVVLRQALGVLAELLAEGFGEARIVEDADSLLVQVGGHAGGVTNLGKCAEQNDPVVAGKHAGDLSGVPLGQGLDAHSRIIVFLFGSGYAGLGIAFAFALLVLLSMQAHACTNAWTPYSIQASNLSPVPCYLSSLSSLQALWAADYPGYNVSIL
jgi:hypothetical protein